MSSWPWFFAGLALGAVNVLFLKASVDRLGDQAADKDVLWFALGMVVRLVLLVGVMLLAVRQGLHAALFAVVGFTLVRWPLLIWLNRRDKCRPPASGATPVDSTPDRGERNGS